jgi:hypothetical protein
MIKKNTKIIFQDAENNATDELIGGISLSKGETITVKKDGSTKEYEVVEKNTEFIFEDEDQIANIEYVLKEK